MIYQQVNFQQMGPKNITSEVEIIRDHLNLDGEYVSISAEFDKGTHTLILEDDDILVLNGREALCMRFMPNVGSTNLEQKENNTWKQNAKTTTHVEENVES